MKLLIFYITTDRVYVKSKATFKCILILETTLVVNIYNLILRCNKVYGDVRFALVSWCWTPMPLPLVLSLGSYCSATDVPVLAQRAASQAPSARQPRALA